MLGCCLVSLNFLCYILCSHSVHTFQTEGQGEGGGFKNPKICRTSYVYGPLHVVVPSDSLFWSVAVSAPFLPPLDEIVDSTDGADGRSGGAGYPGGLPIWVAIQ